MPEVASVYGKAGRAETATDPAPLEMFETTIQFKPREQWRAGMTPDKLVEELDRIVKVPGLSNIWVPPIRNRIDMLATGIKSPVGVKVAGADLATIDRITGEIERVLKDVPGVSSALAERLTGGRYVDVTIDRDAAARYGMNIADVQSVIASAVGGENDRRDGRGPAALPDQRALPARDPRLAGEAAQRCRSSPSAARGWCCPTSPTIRITDGPPMLRSENARLSGWVYVDIRGRDLRSAVQRHAARRRREGQAAAGLFDRRGRGSSSSSSAPPRKLKLVVPFTLLIIFVLLYLTFGRFDEALLIMATLPFALVGGIWLLWLLDYNLSVAGAVGFIALAGVAAEFGVIMLLYLKQAWDERVAAGARRRRRPARRDPRRRGAARAAEGDDGRGDPRRPVADHVGQRHRLRGDAAHRRADGRRHDHRAAAVDVRDSGGLPADAAAPLDTADAHRWSAAGTRSPDVSRSARAAGGFNDQVEPRLGCRPPHRAGSPLPVP